MRAYLSSKGEIEEAAEALAEALTDSDQSGAEELKQSESEAEFSAEDSEDNPPDMNTSGTRAVPATVSENSELNASEKLKTRIAQTEDPALRSKLLEIQQQHAALDLILNANSPEKLTKNYLTKTPADLMDDKSTDDDEAEKIVQSDGSDASADTGKYHQRNLSNAKCILATKPRPPHAHHTHMQTRNPIQRPFSTRLRPLLVARNYETRTRREATFTA